MISDKQKTLHDKKKYICNIIIRQETKEKQLLTFFGQFGEVETIIFDLQAKRVKIFVVFEVKYFFNAIKHLNFSSPNFYSNIYGEKTTAENFDFSS